MKRQRKRQNKSTTGASPTNSDGDASHDSTCNGDQLSAFRFETNSSHSEHKPALCITGLGNPGSRYLHTRHNVGFRLVDALASKLHVKLKRQLFSPYDYARFEPPRYPAAEEADNQNARFSEFILIRPRTFMNRSGAVISHVLRRYGPSIRFVIAVDNMDIPAGEARLKMRGGTAGHNGLKSIVHHLDRDFWPLYIGVGRPAAGGEVISHVLGEPDAAEEKLYDGIIEAIADRLMSLVIFDFTKVQQDINSIDVRVK